MLKNTIFCLFLIPGFLLHGQDQHPCPKEEMIKVFDQIEETIGLRNPEIITGLTPEGHFALRGVRIDRSKRLLSFVSANENSLKGPRIALISIEQDGIFVDGYSVVFEVDSSNSVKNFYPDFTSDKVRFQLADQDNIDSWLFLLRMTLLDIKTLYNPLTAR